MPSTQAGEPGCVSLSGMLLQTCLAWVTLPAARLPQA